MYYNNYKCDKTRTTFVLAYCKHLHAINIMGLCQCTLFSTNRNFPLQECSQPWQNTNQALQILKSTSVSVCFRGISRLPSAFVFLRWFKLAHISIQVCTLHDGCKQGIYQQIFNRKSISRKITHPQSWKLQAKLTGEKLKGWSNSREKTNSKLQSKFRNTTDVKNTSGDKNWLMK